MDKNKIKSEILKAVKLLKKHLPPRMYKRILLTGGSAAFLYGSDRPFSDDIDFEIAPDLIPEIEKDFKTEFEHPKKKPVFHSLKAAFVRGEESYDFIAESVIQPPSHSECYRFFLTDNVLNKKETIIYKGEKIFVIPKELLVLIAHSKMSLRTTSVIEITPAGWSFSVTTRRCIRRPVIRLTASLNNRPASQVAQPGVMMSRANRARASSGVRPCRASTMSVCDTTPTALPSSMTTTA